MRVMQPWPNNLTDLEQARVLSQQSNDYWQDMPLLRTCRSEASHHGFDQQLRGWTLILNLFTLVQAHGRLRGGPVGVWSKTAPNAQCCVQTLKAESFIYFSRTSARQDLPFLSEDLAGGRFSQSIYIPFHGWYTAGARPLCGGPAVHGQGLHGQPALLSNMKRNQAKLLFRTR